MQTIATNRNARAAHRKGAGGLKTQVEGIQEELTSARSTFGELQEQLVVCWV